MKQVIRLRTLKDMAVEGKTILYRSPYDIGVKQVAPDKWEIKDDSRIRATLPSLKYLLEKNCKIVVMTWVKRPDGQVVEALRTTPHAQALARLLNHKVDKVDDCVGVQVERRIKKMKAGDILMLENTRFHKEEMVDDDKFARELAKNGELIVFDAFPQAHRMHSSTTGILRHLPSCTGLYLEDEINQLSKLLSEPARPYTVIIGGAKISDKIDAINNLFDLADIFLVGGGVANVFMKAQGKNLADSFVEDVFVDQVKKEKKDWVEYAKEILGRDPSETGWKKFGLSQKEVLGKIVCPLDLVIGDAVEEPKETRTVDVLGRQAVPDGWAALDIGPKTAKLFAKIINRSKTVFWNGPMGKFEDGRFATGSRAVAEAVCEVEGVVVVGGGDTIEVAKKDCALEKVTHLSLAGGATLEFLAGKKLPALEMLKKS